MTCKKCKKEIPEDFTFCPYCGKKAKTLTPTFNNLEWLSVCGDDEFEKEFSILRGMDAKTARAWLFNMHEPIKGYRFRAEWDWWGSGRYRDNITHSSGSVEAEKLRALLASDSERVTKSEVYECNLSKALFRLLGKSVFRTKEEAQAALDDILKGAGRNDL